MTEVRTAIGPLTRLNPLAKIAAPLPAIAALVFARDVVTPTVFLAAAYAVLLVGARLTARTVLLLGVVVPVSIGVVGIGFALWADPAAGGTPVLGVGAWALTDTAVVTGLATGLRLATIMTLAFIGGLTTDGTDLARALVQQLRVPYRVGYSALAAIRFVPRFRRELEVVRQAQRVRGVGGFPPSRWVRTVVPLLAGAIRHAERVALAMDARAFGAHPDRTERHLVPWRRRDAVFVLGSWVVTAAVFVAV